MTHHYSRRSISPSSRFAPPALLAVLCGGIAAVGCSNIEEAPPRPRPANPGATVITNQPEIMRGTVASVAHLDGWRDVVVEGYGLVVGLNGTGHRTMNAQIRAHMLGEMSRRGVGSEATGFTRSPEALLNDMNTAVVVVKGIVPPGATAHEIFDLHVSLMPDTEATSLDGGVLWTSELRPAMSPGMPPVGSRQARPIALGRGKVFTNPFVEPGADGSVAGGTIDSTTGRVIGGGVVTRDVALKLRLATRSHNIASILQQIINSKFPQEPGQRRPTAWGESDESIEISVPPSFQGRQQEFIRLLEHTSINPSGLDVAIAFVNRTVEQSPAQADHASWRWQAMGRQVLPAIKKFYTSPDERPRFAAIRAGARLDDPLVIPHLLELARSASPGIRKEALKLLGDMRPDARVIVELRDLLNDPSTDIRVATYEALEGSGTNLVRTNFIEGKYRVDYVESDRPLIYVALLREPRIVVFGRNLEVERPMTLSAWSNRLLMKGDAGYDTVEVAYRDAAGNAVVYRDVPAQLSAFIPFLGHTPTVERPQPGLGLSYSETIGVLFTIFQSRYLQDAEFITEADRLRLAILDRERDPGTYEDRPEFERDRVEETEEGAAGDLGEFLPLPTEQGNSPSRPDGF